jgi:ribosomal protein S12 methylthiotransferase accessory factor
MEVIERDSIAVTWLQHLPLPPLASCYSTDRLLYLLSWCQSHFLTTYLFNATTEFGVPTVYALQIANEDSSVHQVVGCATACTLGEAAERALLEILYVRQSYYGDVAPPKEYREFHNLTDGARYMAHVERMEAFGFLLAGLSNRLPVVNERPLPDDPAAKLQTLVDALGESGMQAIAVERTCRELADVGLTAVSVVIPDLQPMSLKPLAQFRAHGRLFTAPPRLGFRSLPEEELNPWPQPFA